MIKGIIFDLDGTLVNTIIDLTNSLNEALALEGYNVSYSTEDTKYLVGKGIRNLCKNALNNITSKDEDIDSLFVKFKEVYKRRQLENSFAYEGVEKTIYSLKEKGIKLGVLSNKDDANTSAIILNAFKENTFDIVWGKKKDLPLKPDPTSLLLMVKELGLSKDEILYVGDSESDMKVGQNALIKTIGVSWGFRKIEELKVFSPYQIISSMEEILKIVENNL